MGTSQTRAKKLGSVPIGRLAMGALAVLPVLCVASMYVWREVLGLSGMRLQVSYGGTALVGLGVGYVLFRLESQSTRALTRIREVLRLRGVGDMDPGLLPVAGAETPSCGPGRRWCRRLKKLAGRRNSPKRCLS